MGRFHASTSSNSFTTQWALCLTLGVQLMDSNPIPPLYIAQSLQSGKSKEESHFFLYINEKRTQLASSFEVFQDLVIVCSEVDKKGREAGCFTLLIPTAQGKQSCLDVCVIL